MSDARHDIPQSRIADVLASIVPTATQIAASRDGNGRWTVTWHGDRAGSTVNGYRPDPPRTPPQAA
jgi:hypothetical protein